LNWQAIFDAILVHIVNSVSADGKWQQLQQQMCDALNRKKDEHTIGILESYSEATVIFVQARCNVLTETPAIHICKPLLVPPTLTARIAHAWHPYR
jgi:hypothetical protein